MSTRAPRFNRRAALAALGASMLPHCPTALAAEGQGERGRSAIARSVEWRDITLIDGATLRAADLRTQNVIVEIWATWCPFCKKQNPHLQALHEAISGKGATVLTFATDKDVQLVRAYQRKYKYTFAAAMYTPQVERWFGRRRSLPELYVIDRSGRVVVEELGEMFPEDVAALARFANGA